MSDAADPDHPHLPEGADVDKIDALAKLLVAARTDGRALDGVPDELVPRDPAEAQLVDDHVAAITGWPVLGWKIGCTSEHAQQLLGSPGPFAGRVYSVFQSGSTIGADRLVAEPSVEGEFAFLLSSDLAPVDRPRSRHEVLLAIGAVRPSIELVGGRFAALVGTPLALLVADAGANTHLVLGQPVAAELDTLPSVTARMEIDDRVTGRGTGADVLGDPVAALVWLADHLSARGIGLQAGQVVSTGTATQISPLPAGATATVTLDGIGSATVTRA